MGVNLPAHLVVIKSTEVYRKGKTEEYDDNTMLQMIGRAGRPQFDNSGTVVIMTQACNVVSLLMTFTNYKSFGAAIPKLQLCYEVYI